MEIKDNIFTSNKSGFQNYIETDEKITAQKVINLKNKLRKALAENNSEVKNLILALERVGDKDAKQVQQTLDNLGVWFVQ